MNRLLPALRCIFRRRLFLYPLILLASLHGFTGCSRHPSRQISTAFYYWRTTFSLSTVERDYLRELRSAKLYTRFFDIDWDFQTKQPNPIAPIEALTDSIPPVEIIPTVFITNRTLEHLADTGVAPLGRHILEKIDAIAGKYFPSHGIREIQFDCDWTEKTREKYFRLIVSFRNAAEKRPIQLSATIRLHQVKYRGITGVPPVDRGVLMFYNMGNLNDKNTINSILDLDVAGKYLANLDTYPFPLDVALPLYSWGVLLRDGKVIDLINNVSGADFDDSNRFTVHGNIATVIRSTFVNYRHFYPGDMIRLELITPEALNRAAAMLNPHIRQTALSIIYYHLDQSVLQRYHYEDLKNVSAAFQ